MKRNRIMCFLDFSHKYQHNFSFQSWRKTQRVFLKMVGEHGPWTPNSKVVGDINETDECMKFEQNPPSMKKVSVCHRISLNSGHSVCCAGLLKTLWEKEKLLVKSNFSFSHSVFYPLVDISAVFTKFGL